MQISHSLKINVTTGIEMCHIKTAIQVSTRIYILKVLLLMDVYENFILKLWDENQTAHEFLFNMLPRLIFCSNSTTL